LLVAFAQALTVSTDEMLGVKPMRANVAPKTARLLKRLQRIDELFNILKGKREVWKQLHPGKDFPGVVVLQIDQEVTAVVVKSVFQTAAFAGFPQVSFMTKRLGKPGGGAG